MRYFAEFSFPAYLLVGRKWWVSEKSKQYTLHSKKSKKLSARFSNVLWSCPVYICIPTVCSSRWAEKELFTSSDRAIEKKLLSSCDSRSLEVGGMDFPRPLYNAERRATYLARAKQGTYECFSMDCGDGCLGTAWTTRNVGKRNVLRVIVMCPLPVWAFAVSPIKWWGIRREMWENFNFRSQKKITIYLDSFSSFTHSLTHSRSFPSSHFLPSYLRVPSQSRSAIRCVSRQEDIQACQLYLHYLARFLQSPRQDPKYI